MAKVILGVTGSVAAIKTPELYRALTDAGHEVRIVATKAALYFFDPGFLSFRPSPTTLIVDADEWPGTRYQRGDPVLHIELRRWADVLLIAPLDANTLAKLAHGLADNCLTCVYRAWDRTRPILLAPAMNTLMWDNPVTIRHLRQLAEDAGCANLPHDVPLAKLPDTISDRCERLQIVGPVSKRLACEDVGMGAMAEVGVITDAVGMF